MPVRGVGAETSDMEFTRITVDPAVMGGVATLRGLRIPVATVVETLADGMTTDEILGPARSRGGRCRGGAPRCR